MTFYFDSKLTLPSPQKDTKVSLPDLDKAASHIATANT